VNDGFEPSDDTMTDQEIGEEYVDEVDGGIKNVDKETLKAHFDAEAFARDLDFNGEIHEFDFSGTTYCIT
jgi:antirestriction protein